MRSQYELMMSLRQMVFRAILLVLTLPTFVQAQQKVDFQNHLDLVAEVAQQQNVQKTVEEVIVAINLGRKNESYVQINQSFRSFVDPAIDLGNKEFAESVFLELDQLSLGDSVKIISTLTKTVLYSTFDNELTKGNFEEALELIESTKIFYEKKPDILLQIAKQFIAVNDRVNAQKILEKADVSEIKDTLFKIDFLNAKALLYLGMKSLDEAFNLLNQARGIAALIDDPFSDAVINGSFSQYYANGHSDYPNAIYYAKMAFQNFSDAGYPQYGIGLNTNIGEHYLTLNQLDSARVYIEESIVLSLEYGFVYEEWIAQKALGKLEVAYGDYQKGLNHCDKAKEAIDAGASLFFQQNCYECLSDAHEGLGNYDSALHYQKLVKVFRDSIFNKEEISKVTQAEVDYKYQLEMEETNREIAENKLKIEQTRTTNVIISAIGIILLLIAIILFVVYKRKKDTELILLREKDQVKFSQALIQSQEEEKLRISRELHDSVGQDLILLKNKASKISASQLAGDIGNTLNKMREITQGLHPFVLEKFGITTGLNKLVEQIDEHFDIFITSEIENIDGLLSKKKELGVYRIAQEAFNNIIKHSGTEAAQIVVSRVNECVDLTIKDFGKGINFSDMEIKQSLGMKTMQERAKILNAKLDIDSENQKGTTLHLTIPFDHD